MLSEIDCLKIVKGEINALCNRNRIIRSYNTSIQIETRVKAFPRYIRKYQETKTPPRDKFGIRLIYHTDTHPYDTFMAYYLSFLIEQTYSTDNNYKRDYIQNPKDNGYQSIHLNIFTLGYEIEVQIRDVTMDECAKSGTASNYYDE